MKKIALSLALAAGLDLGRNSERIIRNVGNAPEPKEVPPTAPKFKNRTHPTSPRKSRP